MPNQKNQTLSLLLIVAWILLVLGGYYYFHKPLTVESLPGPLTALLDVLISGAVVGLLGGFGRWLWRMLHLPRLDPLSALERASLQVVLGAGAASLLWFGIGGLNLYSAWLAWVLLAAGWLALRRDALAWMSEYRSLAHAWTAARRLEKIMAMGLLVMLIYQLFYALAPALKWDALSYHLQLPRLYLANGGLAFIPENPYWGHAQLTEMLFTFAMALHRAETAAVLGWLLDVLMLAGLIGFAGTRFGNAETPGPAGWAAGAALLAGYTPRYIFGWAYTDLFSALIGLAVMIALFEWLDTKSNAQPRLGWWLVTCLLAGLATTTKWTAGIIVIGVVLVSFFELGARRLALRHWLLGGLLVALPVLPWLLHNLTVTGNPVYPYFFATPWISAARMAEGNLATGQVDWWMRLPLPLTLTWSGVESSGIFLADLGPLLLMFGVFGFWQGWKNPAMRALALLILPAWPAISLAGVKYVHLGQPRLYFVLLPALAAAAGLGWDWLQAQVIAGVRLRRIFGAVIVLVIGLAWWGDTRTLVAMGPIRQVLGLETRQSYLENNLGWYARVMQELNNLPPGSQPLLLWEARGFYAPLNAHADPWIDRYRSDLLEYATAAELIAHWKSQGITHLLVYQLGLEFIRPAPAAAPGPRWTTWQELTSLLPPPTIFDDAYSLYQLP